MRLSDLAKGTSVFLGVIVAGYVSAIYVDQRFATPFKKASPAAPTSTVPADSPAPAGSPAPSACVGEGGSWKNWPFPNVPTLSPKCP
jgi:hypothetical protein